MDILRIVRVHTYLYLLSIYCLAITLVYNETQTFPKRQKTFIKDLISKSLTTEASLDRYSPIEHTF